VGDRGQVLLLADGGGDDPPALQRAARDVGGRAGAEVISTAWLGSTRT